MKWMTSGNPSESESGRLTPEDLWAAIEALEQRVVSVCGATEPHVFHPKDLEYALANGAWLVCGNCFSPVKVDKR